MRGEMEGGEVGEGGAEGGELFFVGCHVVIDDMELMIDDVSVYG